MKLENRIWFLDEPTDGGGGEGEGDVSRGTAVFSQTPKTGTGERPLPEPKPKGEEKPVAGSGEPPAVDKPVDTPSAGTVDAAKLAKELGTSIAAAFKEGKAEDKPQLTPEEAKKLLKVWEPDEEWYKEFANLDTQKGAVSKMRDALIAQADTLAQGRLHETRTALEEQLKPIIEYVQRQQDREAEQEFGKLYPQLAAKEFKPLIYAVANELKSKETKFESQEDLFKALANGVESVIKQTNPEFKLTAGSTPVTTTKPKGQNANAIPTVTPGSGGGGGDKGGSGKVAKPRGLSIFDNK